MAGKIAVILSKSREGLPEQARLEKAIVAGLGRRREIDLVVMPHLYDLAAESRAVEWLKSVGSDMIVLAWLYPRSAYWVLDAHQVRGRLGRTFTLPDDEPDEAAARSGTVVPDRTLWCCDLRAHTEAGPYLDQIAAIIASTVGSEAPAARAGSPVEIDEPSPPRWYPVIDFGRCTNCLECLNFCLFGVFGLDESEGIAIDEPDACRDGCPACSRICPAGAIMFPQHHDPAIAGDPKASKEGLKLDLSQLFGGVDPAELAAAERDRAWTQKQSAQRQPGPAHRETPSSADDLDRLVDELDDADL